VSDPERPSVELQPLPEGERHRRRLDLIWELALFQAKLLADGLRDLLLFPVSIVAGLMGLIAGGDEPDQYFRRVVRLGRRSEIWINLFGQHRRGPTSDRLAQPLQHTLEAEFERGGWVRRSADRLNAVLDAANARSRARDAGTGADDDARTSPLRENDAPKEH
jgi:hypothetical protein